MEELKFKTNLKCGGCKDKITPGMNTIKGVEKWSVNLESDDKTLTVLANEKVENQVIDAVEKVGFEIERA